MNGAPVNDPHDRRVLEPMGRGVYRVGHRVTPIMAFGARYDLEIRALRAQVRTLGVRLLWSLALTFVLMLWALFMSWRVT